MSSRLPAFRPVASRSHVRALGRDRPQVSAPPKIGDGAAYDVHPDAEYLGHILLVQNFVVGFPVAGDDPLAHDLGDKNAVTVHARPPVPASHHDPVAQDPVDPPVRAAEVVGDLPDAPFLIDVEPYRLVGVDGDVRHRIPFLVTIGEWRPTRSCRPLYRAGRPIPCRAPPRGTARAR